MKAVKYWATSILSDLVMFGLFVLWTTFDVKGAGNAFLFLAWFFAVLRLLIGVSMDKTAFKEERPAGFGVYHGVTEFAMVIAMAWCGLFWLCSFHAISLLAYEAARVREPKEAKP